LRRSVPLALALSLLGGAAQADDAGQSCRTSHNLVGACFVVHGRLFETTGAPRIRIESAGGKQILLVLDRQSRARGAELVPGMVNVLLTPNPSGTDVYGDYEVCPFEKNTTGITRAVCIQSASHLSLRHR
jgi:hypothetical protein